MRLRQMFTALVVAPLFMVNVFTVLNVSAEELEETVPIESTAELVTEGEQTGLYVTLNNAPADLTMVKVDYSFGGLNYIEEDGKIWEDESCLVGDTGSLTLQCYQLDEYPLAAFLSGAVNSLYIKVSYYTSSSGYHADLAPIRFSHDITYKVPEIPPPFSADFKLGWFSYRVIGHFKDFPPNVAKVSSTYSWDGINYQYSNPDWPIKWDLKNLGNEDLQAQERLQNQEIVQHYEEPMVSFLAGAKNSFYLRLEITTENNEVYYSQPAYISRGERQPLPENLTPRIALGFDLSVMEAHNVSEYYTHGEYQVTVPKGASPQEIRSLLPDTVPVRVRLWDKYTKEKYTFSDLSCMVKWKALPALSLTAGEPYIIEDLAEPLEVPAGTDVTSALGVYTLQDPLTFKSRYDSDDIHLVLNPVSAEEGPRVALRGYNHNLIGENGEDKNEVRADQAMSLAFWNKPSGAVSIKAYSVVDNVQTEICDLLDRRKVNHNQSHALYGYVDLLQPDEYPFKQYLNREMESFFIKLEIEGGVYDGKQVMLPWPMEYEGPEEVFDPYGFDGQENNAGSGYEEIENGSSENGGQPPWFSQEEEATQATPTPAEQSHSDLPYNQEAKNPASAASKARAKNEITFKPTPQAEKQEKNQTKTQTKTTEEGAKSKASVLPLILKVILVCLGIAVVIIISRKGRAG